MARFQSDLEFIVSGKYDINYLKNALSNEIGYDRLKYEEKQNELIISDITFDMEQFYDYAEDIAEYIIDYCPDCNFYGSVSYYQMNADGEYTYRCNYKDKQFESEMIEAENDTPCSAYCPDCDYETDIYDWKELTTLPENEDIRVCTCSKCGNLILLADQPIHVTHKNISYQKTNT